MSDYIDRQAAIDAVMALMPSLTTADGSEQFDAEIYRVQELFVDIGQVLNDLPSAEVESIKCEDCKTIIALKAALEPVKRGRWAPVTNGRGGFECSICHSYAPSYQDGVEWLSLYCPNCGAKMDSPTIIEAEEGAGHE